MPGTDGHSSPWLLVSSWAPFLAAEDGHKGRDTGTLPQSAPRRAGYPKHLPNWSGDAQSGSWSGAGARPMPISDQHHPCKHKIMPLRASPVTQACPCHLCPCPAMPIAWSPAPTGSCARRCRAGRCRLEQACPLQRGPVARGSLGTSSVWGGQHRDPAPSPCWAAITAQPLPEQLCSVKTFQIL